MRIHSSYKYAVFRSSEDLFMELFIRYHLAKGRNTSPLFPSAISKVSVR